MVSALLRFLHKDISSMNQAAVLLGVFSLVSQIFGLVRDRLLASFVGPSASLDVYYAAFRIPDFIYNSVAILFSVTVIIPFITEYVSKKDQEGEKKLRQFLNTIFSVYSIGMIGVSLLVFLLMPWLTHLTAPGFSIAQRADLVLYSRIMLLSPFLMGLSSLLTSFAQAQKKFFAFAIAPVFYNFGILFGILLLRPSLGMLGVVLGVVGGAVLYFAIQIPTLISLKAIPRFVRIIEWGIVKKVIRLSLPRTFASSLTNTTFIIIGAIASLLASGSISIFQFSYNIQTTPLMIIGISYAVAAFPALARLHAEKDHRSFMDMVHRTTRTIVFLSVPIALFMIVLRAQIVRVLLGAGEFSWNDTRLVAASLALFCLSVTAQCMVLLLVRAFYAIGNTKTPLRINSVSVGVTVLSSVLLLLAYKESSMFRDVLGDLLRIDGVVGASVVLLSFAFSLGQITNAILLWRSLHKHMQGTDIGAHNMNRTLFHTFGASIIASAAIYGTLSVIGSGVDQARFIGVLAQGVVSAIVGIAMYVLVLFALKNEDIIDVIKTIQSKFWKAKPLITPQPEL
jgi:putative peptidoglycan lipid II flippase